MKNGMQWTRIKLMFLAGCVGFAWLTGCQTLQNTSFAPVEARLELIPGGGAQHLVVINSSGQVLHNFRFRAYMWDDHALTYMTGPNGDIPKRLPAMTYTFIASGSQWETNQVQRFKNRDLRDIEGVILLPVSRLQIVGRCDEGRFREEWQITPSGQLHLIGAASSPTQP